MMQFIPQLATEPQQIETQQIAQDIKKQEGIQAYIYFKKLCIMAMYGSMQVGYITYQSFLNQLKMHLPNSIFTFWNIKNPYNKKGDKIDIYGLDVKIFNQTPLNLIPTIMKQSLKRNKIQENYKNIMI
jgi:hypothetical protein